MRTTTTVGPTGEVLKVVTGSIIEDVDFDETDSSDEMEEKVVPPV